MSAFQAMAPIDYVLLVSSAIIGLAVARTLPSLVTFYSWFNSCGFEMANHRGYGQTACRFFGAQHWPSAAYTPRLRYKPVVPPACAGVIPAPKLSVSAMALSGLAFLAMIVAPAVPGFPLAWRAPALGAALIPYHLYFSQLYCEAHVGAHVIALIPPALILLALSPALDESAAAPAQTASFTCWLMKIVLTSAYCSAGVCKISHSRASTARGGNSWFSGATLQAFIFEAMYLSKPSTHSSFGLPTPFSHAVQKLHLLNPRLLLMPASYAAVAFEALAPLVLLAPPHLASVPFALGGIGFHYGIALMQNIDFVSWWAAAYAFFLADPAAWAGGALFACPADEAALGLAASAAAALEAAPLRASLALGYVAVHLLAIVVGRYFPHVRVLPLSHFPMFGTPQNIFDRNLRKHLWLTHKPHASGTLKNYAFPFCCKQRVEADELGRLPFNYLLFSHGGKPDRAVLANVEVTPRLQAALDAFGRLSDQEQHTFATDPTAAPSLLAALDEARAAFDAAPRKLVDDVGATPSSADALAAAPPAASDAAASAPATTAAGAAAGAPAAAAGASLADGARLYAVRAVVAAAIAVFNLVDAVLVGGGAAAAAARACRGAVAARLGVRGGGAPGAPRKPSVVVVGGSFAGLRVQRELSAEFDVTVVDRKDYFEYTPGVLRLYTQPHRLGALSAPLPRARNKLVVGEASRVEPGAVHVRAAAAAGGESSTALPFDYLLLACGTGYPCAPVKPTAAEPTLAHRQASWDAAAAALRDAPSALVVGGGLVGVELAAEIAEAFPRKPLTLLTSGGALCATLPPKVGAAARAWLAARGVTVRHHAPVDEVDAAAGAVTLVSGEALRAGVVYDCRGNGAPNAAALLGGEPLGGALDGKGRVLVDDCLRCAVGGGHIFAAGDAMHLPSCADLKLGHTAELNADVVAENIRHLAAPRPPSAAGAPAVLHGLATYPHGAVGAPVAPRVFCVSLGEAYGVLSFNGVVVEGALAAVAKPLLEWTKVAACAERPVGVLFWKVGDAAANWLSRRVVKPPNPHAARPLILFDGVCLLCSTFIHFVLDHDEAEAFDFAALQSDYGQAALARAGMTSDLSTMVLIDEAGVHVRSTAALRVISRCGAPYALLYAAILLPRPLRDFGYKCVAAVRYRLFGQDDGSSCRRLTKAMRKRFLDKC